MLLRFRKVSRCYPSLRTNLEDGDRSWRNYWMLLLLRDGVVEVAREETQIARISEPGSVFGELAVLLDKPHTADVRAVERSVFSVADGATLLTSDPAATLYIAAILASAWTPPTSR